MRSAVGAVLVAAMAVGCAEEPLERRVVSDGVDAMGGLARVVGVATLLMEGEGEAYNLGQNHSPEADLPVFRLTDYRRQIDYAERRTRIEQTRTAQFPTGLAPVVRQVMGLDGEVAFNLSPEGRGSRVPGRAAWDRRAEVYHTPVGIMKAAVNGNSRVNNGRHEDVGPAVDITTDTGYVLTLVIDESSRLPARVSSTTYHPNLGDIRVETEFSDYEDVDGLQLPTRIVTRYDDWAISDIRVRRNVVNSPSDDLVAPAEARQGSAEAAPPEVEVEEVSSGIWYLTGGSHHSVVVELSDHLVLFEAPQSEARTLAVIGEARALREDKPLTKMVLSHHHFDHSAGLRAAVSEGLTIVAQENNRMFIEEIARRSHTVVEDALARSPAVLQLETFEDELVWDDRMRRVALYHIEGNPHASTLTMAYLPRERLLIQADAYNPAAPGAELPRFPFADNLRQNIQSRNLRVDRFVPLHGRVVSWGEFMKAVDHERRVGQTE